MSSSDHSDVMTVSTKRAMGLDYPGIPAANRSLNLNERSSRFPRRWPLVREGKAPLGTV